MNDPAEKLRILMLEDTLSDAELAENELREAGLTFTTLRVDTSEAFSAALRDFKPDIVLADYRLPAYNGRDALDYVLRTYPHIPVIMVTGALGDAAAIELLKLGARDYVLKDHLVQLAPAVQRALSEEHDIHERQFAEEKLLASEMRYRRLFEAAKDGILILNADTGMIEDVNPFLIEMLGYSHDEFLGKQLWEISLFKDIAANKAAFLELQEHRYVRYEDLPLKTKDGRSIWVEFVSNTYDVGDKQVVQCNIRDISNRKAAEMERVKAEAALREKEKHYRLLFESMLNGFAYCKMIYENDKPADFIYLEVNDNFEKLTGLKDVVGKKVSEAIPGIQRSNPELFEIYDRVVSTGKPEKFETFVLTMDMWFSISVYSPEKGYFIAVFEVITERKKAEEALKESEEKFRSITQTILDAIIVMDDQGKLTYWNPAAQKIFGYDESEVMGRDLHKLLAPERYYGAYSAAFPEFVREGTGTIIGSVRKLEAIHKDGHEFPIELSVSAFMRGDKWHAIGVLRDITKQKLAEETLRKSKDLLQSVVETAPMRIFWKDLDLRYLGCNTQFARDAGLSNPSELIGKSDFDMGWKDQAELYRADDRITMESGNPKLNFEEPQTTPDGNTIWLSTSKVPLRNEKNEVIGILGIYHDITGRKKAEAEILKLNRIYHMLSDCNHFLVRIDDENELISNICNIIIGDGGYRMAWVGYKQDDENKTIRPVAFAGEENGYLEHANITWADNDRGRGPAGTAMRSGQTVMIEDIRTDPRFVPWRDEAIRRGYVSSIALPLLHNEDVFAVLTIYDAEPNAFITDEVELLRELAEDMAYGITNIRIKYEQELSSQKLRLSELRYRNLFENSPIALWELDFSAVKKLLDTLRTEGVMDIRTYLNEHDEVLVKCISLVRVTDVNRAALSLHKAQNIAKLLDFLGRIFTPRSYGPLINELVAVWEGRSTISMESVVTALDGEERNIFMNWYVPKSYSDDLSRVLVSMVDITEQKQAEKEIQLLNEELENKVKERTAQLEATNKELEAFTYSVSHDLRAPLRIIDGFSVAVMEDYADKIDKGGKDYLERIHHASQKMSMLIDDLLSLSRLTRSDTNRIGVDISHIASEVIKTLRESDPGRDVDVTITENMTDNADPRLMDIALTNLLSNSWKYTSKKDKAKIEFGTFEKDKNKVYYIKDNGAGFDMNYASKMFQPFQRLHTEEEFPGTGIGLATVYRVIKKHGGNIWAEGEIGKGATFYFTLGG